MRRHLSLLVVPALVAGLFSSPLTVAQAQVAEAPESGPITVRAGYGEADATWNVGAGAGQYTEKNPDNVINSVSGGDVDPHGNSIVQKDSYGVQSRLSYRAIVVEDGEGDQVALVKSDSYLAQDYLARRVGQLLTLAGSEISYEEIFHMASHNHSSPYYSTPSWGVWIFQDAFDIRAFEYQARAMADAILEAEDNLAPARMGATTVEHKLFKGMIARKGFSDDGTPRGYPDDFGDFGLPVIRFDSLEDPANPKPIATLINWGLHPEGLDDHDLITGDFVASLERFVERETGAPLVFGQGDVGSSEAGPGFRKDVADLGIPARWSHFGHAQAERGGYVLAQDVIKGWNQIAQNQPSPEPYTSTFVTYSSDFDVEAGNAFVAGPVSHPVPTVSNCRSEPTVQGDTGIPVTGFPDCDRGGTVPVPDHPFGGPFGQLWNTLEDQGVPLPDQYGAPSFTGVQENTRLKLQAFKLGEVLLASCACEAQVDLILNLESRTNETQGDIWDGFDWTKRMDCTQAEPPAGDWTCRPKADEPRPYAVLGTHTFTDAEYDRMLAQIHNDAKGWNDPQNALRAESEPDDPEQIWGNFTKTELPADLGYKLPIGVGHAGDFNGYTVSYREYQSYDHYRKALTSNGPHTADYMVTNLMQLAGRLNGGDAPLVDEAVARGLPDEARQVAASTALGAASMAAYEAWYRALPKDAVPADPIVTQPRDIKRFDAAQFSWIGGSNAIDNPLVTVERLVDGQWQTFADQTGEVQTRLEFADGINAYSDTYSGNQEWKWTANFEAFNANPKEIGSTPVGEYRFVVQGKRRGLAADEPYELVSKTFRVDRWDGVSVSDLKLHDDGSVSFAAASVYPRSYPAGTPRFPYITEASMKSDEMGKSWCTQCSFRPWANGGEITSATLTAERADGTTETVEATRDGQRWHAAVTLYEGDRAYVASGGVTDEYGERNGSGSGEVTGRLPREDEEEEVRPTTLEIIETAGSGQYSDTIDLSALVTSEGEPVADAPVTFEVTGAEWSATVSATTGADGRATAPLRLEGVPGPYVVTARFDGNESYEGSADVSSLVIEKEDSALALTIQGKSSQTTLRALLSDADSGAGIGGRSIAFFADGQQMGTAVTDGAGVADFAPPARYRGGNRTYEARFDGDRYYEASTGTAR